MRGSESTSRFLKMGIITLHEIPQLTTASDTQLRIARSRLTLPPRGIYANSLSRHVVRPVGEIVLDVA